MMNVECRISSEETGERSRHLLVVRHSSFGVRHSTFLSLGWTVWGREEKRREERRRAITRTRDEDEDEKRKRRDRLRERETRTRTIED